MKLNFSCPHSGSRGGEAPSVESMYKKTRVASDLYSDAEQAPVFSATADTVVQKQPRKILSEGPLLLSGAAAGAGSR